ncbi:MAG: FHA domain-containing protein [Actinomycetes bacterium]
MTSNTPAGPVVVSAPRCTAAVGASGDELVEALRAAAVAIDPLGDVVQALAGSVTRSLPTFAVVLPEEGRVRILVRGAASVAVTTADGRVTVACADGVSTWNEQVVDGAADVTAVVAGVCVHVPLVLVEQPTEGRAAERGDVGTEAASVAEDRPDATLAHQPDSGAPPPAADPDPSTLAGDHPASGASTVAADHRGPGAFATAPGNGTGGGGSAPSDPGTTLLPSLEPPPSAPTGDGSDGAPDSDVTQFRPLTPSAASPAAGHGAARAVPASADGFIDAVPGRAALRTEPEPERQPTATATPAPTFMPAPVPSSVPLPDVADAGRTMSVAELRAAAAGGAAPGQPSVQAVSCPAGHPNPPHADRCRSCDVAITDREVRTVARPSLGRLRFDDGLVVELDRTVVLGRKPTPSVDGGGAVTIPDEERTLSRDHAEVRVVDWQVFVVDRHSTNGTSVQIPGQPLVQLRPDDPYLITGGTAVMLGDLVRFVFDVSPS